MKTSYRASKYFDYILIIFWSWS